MHRLLAKRFLSAADYGITLVLLAVIGSAAQAFSAPAQGDLGSGLGLLRGGISCRCGLCEGLCEVTPAPHPFVAALRRVATAMSIGAAVLLLICVYERVSL